jgi:hypothetical protein
VFTYRYKIHEAAADQRSEQKTVSDRRKPVPTVGMDPGFRREDDDGRVALDRPNESER